MKKRFSLVVFLLLFSTLIACSTEKKQNYFVGTIVKITDNYFVIVPDDGKLLDDDLTRQLLVPKEVVRAQEINFSQGERVQVVYNKITNSQSDPKIDIVYAIYRESELP